MNIDYDSEEDFIKKFKVVNSIVPGGAAARQGELKTDDRIIAVAQREKAFESVIDMCLNNVVQLIRGKRGTKVGLSYTINPDFRGNKIGQLLMQVYLIDRRGQFFCDVKNSNIPSIKMIEKLGFELFSQTQNVNTYKLIK